MLLATTQDLALPLLLGASLLMGGCQPEPIRLRPTAAAAPHRAVARAAAQAPHPARDEPAVCASTEPELSDQRKEELFRSFTAEQPRRTGLASLMPSDRPATAGVCRAAGW